MFYGIANGNLSGNPSRPPYKNQAQQQNTNTTNLNNNSTPDNYPPNSIPYENACDNPADDKEYNLCQQRRMADASESILAATRFQNYLFREQNDWLSGQTVLYGFEILVLGCVLAATIATANIAKRSSEIAQESLRATQRAFIAIDKINQRPIIAVEDTSRKTGHSFSIKLRNFGHTQACHMAYRADAKIYQKGIAPNLDYEKDWGIPIDLGPQGKVSIQAIEIPIDLLMGLFADELEIILRCSVKYVDVFDVTHFYEQMIQITPYVDPSILHIDGELMKNTFRTSTYSGNNTTINQQTRN